MAKPQQKPQDDTFPVDAPERSAFTGPRVPVGKLEVIGRIREHLEQHDANLRIVRADRGLMRLDDTWVIVDVSKGEPADIDALGRKLGVLDQCEVIV